MPILRTTAALVCIALVVAACRAEERAPVRLRSSAAPWGGLRVHSRGDPEADRVLVLLHGYRAPGDDLVSLAEELAARTRYRVLAPEAPLQSAGGRAWFEIRDGVRVPAEVARAREAVQGVLATLRSDGIGGDRVVLGGFSQGAMLSIDLAVSTDEPLAGTAALSGGALPFWQMRRREGLPVFMAHGRGDPVLGYAAAEDLRDALRASGAAVEFHAFDGGHTIPAAVVDALAAFLVRLRGND